MQQLQANTDTTETWMGNNNTQVPGQNDWGRVRLAGISLLILELGALSHEILAHCLLPFPVQNQVE